MVKAGQVIVAETLTNEAPDKYILGQMSVDELINVAKTGGIDGLIKKSHRKPAVVDIVFDNWSLLCRRVREIHQAEPVQPSTARGSDEPVAEPTEGDGISGEDSDDETSDDETSDGETSDGSEASQLCLSDFFDTSEDCLAYDTGDIPETYLKSDADFNDKPRTIWIGVKNPHCDRLLALFSFVDASITVPELKDMITKEAEKKRKAMGETKMPLLPEYFRLQCGMRKMKDSEKVTDHMEEQQKRIDVEIHLVLKGGGLVRRHQGKATLIAKLKKKASLFVQRLGNEDGDDADTTFDETVIPDNAKLLTYS